MLKRIFQKIKQRLTLYRQVEFFQYLYLNHFCKQVVRTDRSHIIPYKNAVIDLASNSKIYLGGGDIEIGCDRMKGSKTETRIRLRESAIWSNQGGCRISYGTTLEVLSGGVLDTQFFTINSNSVVIAAKRIQLGEDVMMGRNVMIYDSDHHSVFNQAGKCTNPDAEVIIGSYVWLASNVSVLKGAVIGDHALVSANTIVHGQIPAKALYRTQTKPVIRENYGRWDRKHPV